MFLSASPRETLRFSRNKINDFPRAGKLWVYLSCFNHVKEGKRRFQTVRNLPYTYQAMRCAQAHKCNQYSTGEPEPHSTSSTDTTKSSDLIKLISVRLNSVIRHCMTLTPTVAVDCWAQGWWTSFIPGTVIKQYLETITLCVFFYVITVIIIIIIIIIIVVNIIIIMMMMIINIIIIITTISPYSFDKYG